MFLTERVDETRTEKRTVLVRQARAGMPGNTGIFATRVLGVRERMDELQRRLAALSERQSRFLQDLAVHQLEAQRQRIEVYQIQARYELAAIYDKASAPKPKANP